MGAAEATKLDDEFSEMERKIDLTYELIGALTNGTNEYLQPNPGECTFQAFSFFLRLGRCFRFSDPLCARMKLRFSATRAKMAAMATVSKVRGTTKSQAYPQTEGLLSEMMVKYGKGLGDDSDLGKALCDAAEAFRQMADIKYQLEDVVKHNFLDPITHLLNNELKDVNVSELSRF